MAGSSIPNLEAHYSKVHPVESRPLRVARILARNWGTPLQLHPREAGREKASVLDGGRRRRSSQTPGGNRVDRVKVRQGKLVKMKGNGLRGESR